MSYSARAKELINLSGFKVAVFSCDTDTSTAKTALNIHDRPGTVLADDRYVLPSSTACIRFL